MNRQRFSTDTFLVFQNSFLGVGYIGACYTANIRTQIGIVATENDTLVRVTLPRRPQHPDFAVTVEHNGRLHSIDLLMGYIIDRMINYCNMVYHVVW